MKRPSKLPQGKVLMNVNDLQRLVGAAREYLLVINDDDSAAHGNRDRYRRWLEHSINNGDKVLSQYDREDS